MNRAARRSTTRPVAVTADPLWFKTAIIYEAHIRAFADSNADGIGDLVGMTDRLDYLHDLGVTALWILPFYPSPLRDGGYDIADYYSINPAYGTMADFERFLDEAHRRGIRVITELVLNHTSVDHAWFQRARHAPPGSAERDFYVWSDHPGPYGETRIIFKDFETSNWAWDPVAKAYYWHRFYSHQADLNFDNPAVHDALLAVVDFWFDKGVDGMRLDAVPYLYEREGTSCENLPETHAFLRKLRAHVDARYRDRMLLAEANQWPIDAAAYFGDGDECHMNFHFPLMPRMFMALHQEDSFPLIDILGQTPPIPETCAWATFLRNHDELTLEMVTDEERDYMYRVYTEDPTARINLGIRRRLAPLLGSRPKIELMTALLFSLPGTPVLYYGDEIGMGDNVFLGDRDGVRTPMQWSADRNAGFSRANPQRLYLPVIYDPEYHYETINVEAQEANPQSLLWWTKRMIALRKDHPVLGRGDMEFLRPDNHKVLAFLRSWQGQTVLVVANLSRHPQYAELDLAGLRPDLAGTTPVEMIGRTRFPSITERPFLVTLGPHNYLWFELEPPPAGGDVRTRPHLTAVDAWTEVADDRRALARALAAYATERRWFRGKARTQRHARIADVLDLPGAHARALLFVLEIEYADGEPDLYLVPVGFVAGEPAAHLEHRSPHAVIASLDVTPSDPDHEAVKGVLYDVLATGEAAAALVDVARGRAEIAGAHGRLVGTATAALEEAAAGELPAPRASELEQTNSTVPFGDRLIIKVFRAIEGGISAELELGTFLTERTPDVRVPAVLGSVAYHPEAGEPASVAVIHELVVNQGTAWSLLTGELQKVLEAAIADAEPAPAAPAAHLLALATSGAPGRPDTPGPLVLRAGGQLRWAALLGRRTAEVHLALGSGRTPAFAPERFTLMHQQSLYQGARATLVRTFELLAKRQSYLPEDVHDDVRRALAAQAQLDARLRLVQDRLLDAIRVRSHGDLHLGQVLYTGDDFVIIDFEGEPARPLGERRYKRSALRDVAGMLRSFAYAGESCVRALRAQDAERARPWTRAWTAWMGAAYLSGYLEVTADAALPLVPRDPATARLLLDFYWMEKCVYEIGYELNNRPAWLPIPLHGLVETIARSPDGSS